MEDPPRPWKSFAKDFRSGSSAPLRNPSFSSPYDYIDVGSALAAVGETAHAHEVLRVGMKLGSTQPRKGNWSEVSALSLLGEHAQACRSIEQSASRGEFLGMLALTADLDLATLRAQPCFAPAYAKLKALSDVQIAAATKAGLIKPLKPADPNPKKTTAAPPAATKSDAPTAAPAEEAAATDEVPTTIPDRKRAPTVKRPLKRLFRTRD